MALLRQRSSASHAHEPYCALLVCDSHAQHIRARRHGVAPSEAASMSHRLDTIAAHLNAGRPSTARSRCTAVPGYLGACALMAPVDLRAGPWRPPRTLCSARATGRTSPRFWRSAHNSHLSSRTEIRQTNGPLRGGAVQPSVLRGVRVYLLAFLSTCIADRCWRHQAHSSARRDATCTLRWTNRALNGTLCVPLSALS